MDENTLSRKEISEVLIALPGILREPFDSYGLQTRSIIARLLTGDRQNSAKNRIPEISGKPLVFPWAPLFSSLVLLVGRDLLF